MIALQELASHLQKKDLKRESAKRIRNKLSALEERRRRIQELSVRRGEDLDMSRLLCIFTRDAAEVLQIISRVHPLLKNTDGSISFLMTVQHSSMLLTAKAHLYKINKTLVSLVEPRGPCTLNQP